MLLGLLGLIALVGGCSKSQYGVGEEGGTQKAVLAAPASQPRMPGQGQAQDTPMPSLSGMVPSDSLSANSGEQRILEEPSAVSAKRANVEGGTMAVGLQDVFFTYDSWVLNPEGRRALQADLEQLEDALRRRPLLIEGHCDERGTEAYNMVLGERRAKSVQQYLINLGLPANRLGIVSYGEKRPFCGGHDENCYRQNRRAHLAVRQS
jgi:peptidoglycan-associated lipoprotein